MVQRPAESRVRHGNPACANYGCKDARCVEAVRAYKRQNDADRRAGIMATVSVAKTKDHLLALLRADMTPRDVEKVSGVDEKTILKILNGRCARIHWITEEAILGVPVPEYGWESSFDCYVDALPAMRRLQALGVQGFTTPVLSRETGIDRTVIGAIRSGKRPRIRMSSMRAIKKAHDRLYDTDPADLGVAHGDLIRARRWAEKQGWYPTEAWVDIDDPDCKPVLKTPGYIVITENARELIEQQGYSRKAAAERLGVTVDALKWAMTYYDRVKAEAS